MTKRKGDKIFIEGSYQFDAYYNGSKPQRFWNYVKIREAINELNVSGKDKILDAGCGSGLLCSFLAQNDNTEVWGIDSNQSAIHFCNSKYNKPNLHFIQTYIDEMPFESNTFTKIACLEVFEHLTYEQGKETMKRFFELLVPEGKLVISTPNRRSLWPIIETIMDKFNLAPKLKAAQHEFLYNALQLTEIGITAGFNCTSQKTINFLSPWIAWLNWKIGLSVHKLELNTNSKKGSLLLFTFEKK